eukprot:TRINITY_DN30856_c0_g1_i1.p1 TRINITY_DN30856_c0_g1~~TRINITY_DN30856_c0_g1_i1.p1  ORF type:complete len:442 (+),score=75.59 TRINITY_DN30856_c0_g1_i1:54-1328(+)
MFTLLVCGDVYGSKVNLEIPFPNVPTISQLTHTIEEVFEAEAAVLKPAGYPTLEVKVSRIQVYDDTYLKWMDLVSSTQLHEYDQLYVFQPQSPWHVDLQKDLPAPRVPSGTTPSTAAAAVAPRVVPAPQQFSQQPTAIAMSPVAGQVPPQPTLFATTSPAVIQQQPLLAQQPVLSHQPAPQSVSIFPQPMAASIPQQVIHTAPQSLPQPVGPALANRERANLPVEQKIQIVFKELDTSAKGYLDYGDLERGFRSRGIDFSSTTIQELFSKGDTNRDTRIDWGEWVAWAGLYPNTLEIIYYRGIDTADDANLQHQRKSAEEAIERNKAREVDLLRQLEECQREYTTLVQQMNNLDSQTREATTRRTLLEQQERDLLEQEIKLERQKDQLRASQYRFQEVAQTFDHSATVQGSPRRAAQEQVHQFR